MFAIVTILAILILGLALGFRRFRAATLVPAARDEAAKSAKPRAAIGREFGRWLARRGPESVKSPAPGGWMPWIKGLGVWRLPIFEKWLFILFYASFLYLAASGFFFAIFIRRGLYGFPLLLHVAAGAAFAVCLTLIAFLKAGRYGVEPGPLALPADMDGLLKTRFAVSAHDLAAGLFWLFLLAALSLVVSALLPMLPWFPYEGQILLFGWHRWSALISFLAAVAFAEFEFFKPRPQAE